MTNEEHYNTFLEKVKVFNIKDSIYTVWALSNNLQFNKPLPSDIQVRQEYDLSADVHSRRLYGVPEWELEFLCKEIIGFGLIGKQTQYTLRDIRCMGELANDMRILEDAIYADSSKNSSENLIFKQTFRIFHRQMPWQHPSYLAYIYRYYKIFSHKELNPLVQKIIGLSTLEIVQIGFALTSTFLTQPYIQLPFTASLGKITSSQIEKFIRFFSIELPLLKKEIIALNRFDEDLFYKYNPLREFTLIRINDELYCPFPSMFIEQYTGGLYYKLYMDKAFGECFGKSFQDYVGFYIETITKGNGFKLIAESKYKVGKDTKDSIDWIIEDKDTLLFIECKTKRLILDAKNKLLDDMNLISELEKMASFIFQAYKTIQHCIDGYYTNIQYDPGKQGFLLILTLEDWFINFLSKYHQVIEPMVIKKLQDNNINVQIVQDIPYFLDSIKSFERNFQLVNHLGIKEYYSKLKTNSIFEDSEKFEYQDILVEHFQNEIFNEINFKN